MSTDATWINSFQACMSLIFPLNHLKNPAPPCSCSPSRPAKDPMVSRATASTHDLFNLSAELENAIKMRNKRSETRKHVTE